MAEFKVTPEMLRTKAGNIKKIKDKFEGLRTEIGNEMNRMKQKWESDASNAFIKKYNALKDDFDAFSSLIDNYSIFLDKTAEAYEKADKNISNATGNLFS